MAFVMTADFKINPDSREIVDQAIRQFIREILENEPGTLLYTSCRDADEPNRYLHFFVFENETAEQRHRATDWVTRFTDVLYPETIDGVNFNRFDLVSSTSDFK
ncbi:MAG: antibiotic biosynthesis monooxygenase family protein [Anaerolineales bacterium]|nr:antibiotic biosynthesis monooxygenase family protein [Anaerolineales bacterium]